MQPTKVLNPGMQQTMTKLLQRQLSPFSNRTMVACLKQQEENGLCTDGTFSPSASGTCWAVKVDLANTACPAFLNIHNPGEE